MENGYCSIHVSPAVWKGVVCISMSLGMKRSSVYVCSLWEVVKSSLTLQLV